MWPTPLRPMLRHCLQTMTEDSALRQPCTSGARNLCCGSSCGGCQFSFVNQSSPDCVQKFRMYPNWGTYNFGVLPLCTPIGVHKAVEGYRPLSYANDKAPCVSFCNTNSNDWMRNWEIMTAELTGHQQEPVHRWPSAASPQRQTHVTTSPKMPLLFDTYTLKPPKNERSNDTRKFRIVPNPLTFSTCAMVTPLHEAHRARTPVAGWSPELPRLHAGLHADCAHSYVVSCVAGLAD